jgi:hypothetical protein
MNHFHAMSKLTRSTLLMSLIGLSLAIFSNVVNSESKRYFIWLYFYAPALWLFWIITVLTCKDRKEWRYQLVAWWVIDFMIFATLISLSLDMKFAGQSKGADIVMLIAYLPMWFPTILLAHSLPLSASSAQFSAFLFGESSVVALWCEASMYAAIQSAIVFGIAHINISRREKRMIKTEQLEEADQ